MTLRASALQGENCVAINPDNLQLVNVNGQWKIMDGSRRVLQFGPHRSPAELSFNTIRSYGFTSQCSVPLISPVIANPRPTMMYWRGGNSVPVLDRNITNPETCAALHPTARGVVNINGNWYVASGNGPGPAGELLLNFGTDRALADQALAIIRHYNLTRMCTIRYFPDNVTSITFMQYWLSE
ncbi:hypothetical protein DSM104635_00171 [Terricaulis silvestris]|uniref:Uncharacterized protein n=1 Tax=Terricaulis silvestris TaxID=2686094 RepID=A0A6I6MI35_9CAUL|nr:hypothetical protein DSM104635_00171 [Terricaulis silvestris]